MTLLFSKTVILDDYFYKNKNEISKVKQSEYSGPVLMWYDEKYLYIKGKTLTKVLNSSGTKSKFSVSVKKSMAEKGIIESYKKENGQYEYSINLKKQVYNSLKTKGRFVAFNREKCREHDLFKKIEEHRIVPEPVVEATPLPPVTEPAEELPILFFDIKPQLLLPPPKQRLLLSSPTMIDVGATPLPIPLSIFRGSHHLDLTNSNVEFTFGTSNKKNNSISSDNTELMELFYIFLQASTLITL